MAPESERAKADLKDAEEWLAKQPHCASYQTCDGDLEGIRHSEVCPMFGADEPTVAQLLTEYRDHALRKLEVKVAELTKKFETQRSARRSYKKQLNRLSGHVVKKVKR